MYTLQGYCDIVPSWKIAYSEVKRKAIETKKNVRYTDSANFSSTSNVKSNRPSPDNAIAG